MKPAERARSYAHLLAVGLACGRGVRFVNREEQRPPEYLTTAIVDAAEQKRQRKAEKRLRDQQRQRKGV